MKKPITINDFLKAIVPIIYVLIAILAFYNISLQVNHTGSGQPDTIMKKGFFFSPGEGENTAAAAEDKAVDTAQENTQGTDAPEADEQSEAAAE